LFYFGNLYAYFIFSFLSFFEFSNFFHNYFKMFPSFFIFIYYFLMTKHTYICNGSIKFSIGKICKKYVEFFGSFLPEDFLEIDFLIKIFLLF
jgi:hypothetical protein